MKRNGNAERQRRENRGAEGAEGWGLVRGYPLRVGDGSGEKSFDFFVWQWCILVHSGRLF